MKARKDNNKYPLLVFIEKSLFKVY